jgi:paraquat-inducible protein A
MALALTALLLFWPGILLPIITVEKMGYRFESSLLNGTLTLIRDGDWLVGGVVLVFSLVFPLLKLALLLEVGLFRFSRRGRLRHRLLHVAHALGRWGMLDVLLLALLVMLVRLGDVVAFTLGPAAIAFATSVLLSIAASTLFDRSVLWEMER